MSLRKLNSDELGEKGESRFKELCADGQLICNKSDRDRSGWDFIVESSYGKANYSNSLDKRLPALSCHVQVKTMWYPKDRFQMPLAAAERLAKEIKPAFIWVLRVGKNLEFVDSFAIHVAGEVLCKILKRLRLEQKKKNFDISKKTIGFSLKSGNLLNLSGSTYAVYLSECIGEDLNEYSSSKCFQASNLGFDSHPFKGKITIRAKNSETIVDAFLGNGELDVTQFTMNEDRFGIELPILPNNIEGAKLRIKPQAVPCKLVVRHDYTNDAAEFAAELYTSNIPWLDCKSQKYIIKTKMMSIEFNRNRIVKTNNIQFKFDSIEALSEWISMSKLLCHMSRGECLAQIIYKNRAIIHGEIRLNLNKKISLDVEKILIVLENLKYLIKCANSIEIFVSFKNILDHQHDIMLIYSIFKKTTETVDLEFTINCLSDFIFPERCKMLYINIIKIGSTVLAYCITADLILSKVGNSIKAKSTNISPNEIIIVQKENDIQDMEERQKRKTGIPYILYLPV